MAISKKTEFNNRVLEMADLAKAFSHPARIMIIELLFKHKDRTCKEIVAELSLCQPTVSQYLKELLEAGLIYRKQFGSQSLYCVEWNQLERVFIFIERFKIK